MGVEIRAEEEVKLFVGGNTGFWGPFPSGVAYWSLRGWSEGGCRVHSDSKKRRKRETVFV